MNKKGFTLVELLGVIILIAIIISIVFPGVAGVLRKSKKTIKDIQINKILDSAYDYTLKNTNQLPEKDEVMYITLNELKKESLVDNNIKDSTTNENFPDDLVISIANIKYTDNFGNYSKQNGDYLYTVEFEFMNSSDYDNNRPLISFKDYEVPVIIDLNLGDDSPIIEYTAKSIDGTNLTSKVVKNVICNSKKRNNVDTSEAGVCYINYTVVDKNGYSRLSTVSIIVSDNEKPELNISNEKVVISIDVTNYDLLKGVSCTDNSGDCDIKIEGSIDFGVIGETTIKYIVSDPSGNTTIKERVITVE